MDIQLMIEALIFASQKPLKIIEIADILSKNIETEYQTTDIQSVIDKIIQKYESGAFAFGVYSLAGGYQFLTKKEYERIIGTLVQYRSKKRLSKSTLETLAIIAYRQPVTKNEIEEIRGVSSDYAVQKLLDKELIIIKGKSEAVGRPIIYGTSSKFLTYFGIDSLKNLPTLKDFGREENSIGNEQT